MVNIRARLKDLQDSYGSYAELARSMRVDRSTVARWAAGTRKPSKRDRNRINDRWRRSSKRIRNEGATISLTSSFRRLWYRTDIGINSPLNYRKIPRYNWPNDFEVRLYIVFRSVRYLDEEGNEGDFANEEERDPSLKIETLRSTDNLAQVVQDRFEKYIEALQNEKGSNLQVLEVIMDRVYLQSVKNKKPNPKQ